MTGHSDGQSEADKALAAAKAAEEAVRAMKARMSPVLDNIEMHIGENAILEAFRSTIRRRAQ
jgi:hypothetical protein